jgi:hypothetical protein
MDLRRRSYLEMIDRVGKHWLTVFEGDTEFYSAAYWDLFTHLWSAGTPLRKTEALAAMKGVRSAHTAGKYLQEAIKHGLIHEEDNPADGRSKLLRLDSTLEARLNAFFDLAVDEVVTTARRLEGRPASGPAPSSVTAPASGPKARRSALDQK